MGAIGWALALAHVALATSYYWDTNGATSGIGSVGGGTATWLSNAWAAGSSGTMATGSWPNTLSENTDEAVFQGTAGTVTIGTTVRANALRFQTNNYHISSTGGMLELAGNTPKITVNLASNNQVVTISSPITSSTGWTLAGNSLSGGLKFLVLANPNTVAANSFAGPFTIEAGGALRLGGGVAAEQIPDDVDLNVAGVVDFITSGGASDGKQEKVKNLTVTGNTAVFSVGNGSNFVVNSLTGIGSEGISVNGNNASVPGRLTINGWADGQGNLQLTSSRVKLNTTSATAAIGGRIVLSGDISSSGDSRIINNNGNAASASTNTFANKAFDFARREHTVEVNDGTLMFTSAAANHPLEITTLDPAGATITKTGLGTWRWEEAVQSSFVGATAVAEGVLSLARPAFADASDLRLTTGASLELSFAGTDSIAALYIDGVSQATGTWGALTSTAEHKSALISGPGLLQVTSFVAPLLVGDFNNDRVVDAADYCLWRDRLDGETPLDNDHTPESVSLADYDDWKSNFGATYVTPGAAAIPEPDNFARLAFVALLSLMRWRTKLRQRKCIAGL